METRAGEDEARGTAGGAEVAGSTSANGAAGAPSGAGAAAGQPEGAGARAFGAGQIEDLFATVRRLEAFAADEAKRVSGKLVPEIESRAKQNIWVSLLLALGLGLLLGIWLTGGRRRD